MIILENGNIKNSVYYHKPTFTGRFLSFWSHHSFCRKRGMIFDLIDKFFLISDLELYQRNFEFIVYTLLDDDYPLDFIFKTMTVRLKKKNF